MKLGLVARMDKTGLGNQTRSLTELLNPDKILVIDSSSFHLGQRQFPSTYAKRNAYRNEGMIRPMNGIRFLQNIDVLFSCETFYSPTLINDARARGVKTILQYNFEFLENLLPGNRPLPDVLLAPSEWRIEEVRERFGDIVRYLPPPTDEKRFERARFENLNRVVYKPKFLHVVGKQAMHDRNGTRDLIAALAYTDADFELHIRSQTPLEGIDLSDPRVTVLSGSPIDEVDMYVGYDAMVLPRRYAGLCLPMNEALMSALPVIMTDIDPNNRILPPEWLVTSHKCGSFMTKINVDIYSADLRSLAAAIDDMCRADILTEKRKAYKIGYDNFSFEVLRPKYNELLENL